MLNIIYFELVLYFSVRDCLLLIGTNVSDLNLNDLERCNDPPDA